MCLLFLPSRALSSFIAYTLSGAHNPPQTRGLGFEKKIAVCLPFRFVACSE